jgi:diguanylate cyclase (GGDEF)-like protein
VAVLLLALGAARAAAAPDVQPGPAPTPLADPGWDLFRSFGSAQGLPQSTVMALAQDHAGFVYAGTQVGVARYDGRRWERLSVRGLAPALLISRLVATDDGALWVGSQQVGLLRVDGGAAQTLRDARGAPLDTAQAILAASASEVWVGTAGALFRCAPQGCREVPAARGLLVSALDLGDGPRGPALWLGTAFDGVRRLDLAGGEPRLAPWRLGRDEGLPDPNVRALAWWQGALWVGTGRGVTRLLRGRDGRADRLVVYSEANGFPRATVQALAPSVTDDGTPCLWAAQNGGGLSRFAPDGSWRHVTTREGLPEDYFYSLLVTRGVGSLPLLWAGSASSGVIRQERGRWRAWGERAGLPHRVVVGIGEVDEPGDGSVLWAGTLGGAVRWAGGRWVPWLRAQLEDRVLYEVARVGDALWLATDRGVLRWDGHHESWLTSDNTPIPALIVTDLEPRRRGDGTVELWAATNHGLARIDPDGKVTAYPQPFLGPRTLTHGGRASDGSDTLWVGIGEGRLQRYDGTGWQVVRVPCGSGEEILHLLWQANAAGGEGTLWIAHRGGVTRLGPGGECRNLGPAQGVDGPIYQLALDAQGRLYLFGHQGVDRLDTREVAAQRPHLEHFGLQDGLPDLEFDRAAFTDRRGRVWAASVGGIAAYDPSEPALDEAAGPLRLLHAVSRQGRTLAPGEELLSADADVGFEVTLLAYGGEERVRYQMQLEGLDPAPSPWRPDAGVVYNRLPPGAYTFRIRARVGNGASTQALVLPFRVAAPWWRSTWAMLLAAVLLVGGGVFIGHLRDRSLERRAAELAALVAERTHQLAEANRQLEEAAVTDPLTGARNRRYLAARLPADAAEAERRAARGEREAHLALAVVDLDHFKNVNDRCGHAVGDEVLREVAMRLRGLVRLSDFLVRWGGEEFLLVLRDVDREALPGIGQRILHVVASRPVRTAAGELAITCSVGLAAYPFDARLGTVEAALEAADEALYRAKAAGRYRAMVAQPERDALPVLP